MVAERWILPGTACRALVSLLLISGLQLATGKLAAQILRARVSVKMVLDENGNRPSDGFFHQDSQIEEALDGCNEILAASGADWGFDLMEIVDVEAISQWSVPHGGREAADGLELSGEEDPELYAWRSDAINVYITAITDCRGICSFPAFGDDIVVYNNYAWSISPAPLPESSLPGETDLQLAAGYLWLHEFGHYFNLCHTHGCRFDFACGTAQDPTTRPRDGDGLEGTLPDLECWGRDEMARWSFEADYADVTADRQKMVDDTILNVMSYHREAIFAADRTLLTGAQLERMAAEMNPLHGGRRAAVLNLPQPRLTLGTDEPTEGKAILFDAGTSTTELEHEVTSYSWDFGDGSTGEGKQVQHTYATAGLYTVRLVVGDDRDLHNLMDQAVVVQVAAGESGGWSGVQIGSPVVPGGTLAAEDCLRVAGASGNVSRADALHFAQRERAGDFELTGRVASWDAQTSGSMLGFMVREGLGPGAGTVMVGLERRPGGFRHRVLRRRLNGSILRSMNYAVYEEPTVWLRLVRRGSVFSGSLSLDGVSWLEPDAVDFPEFPGTVHVGVASSWVVLEEGGPTALATVCDLSLIPLSGGPGAPFLRGDCDGDALACSGVNDALELLSWLFLGKAKPPCFAACDPDGNDELELTDAVYGLNFCFKGTAAPVAPFPGCGPGTEADTALGCETSNCE